MKAAPEYARDIERSRNHSPWNGGIKIANHAVRMLGEKIMSNRITRRKTLIHPCFSDGSRAPPSFRPCADMTFEFDGVKLRSMGLALVCRTADPDRALQSMRVTNVCRRMIESEKCLRASILRSRRKFLEETTGASRHSLRGAGSRWPGPLTPYHAYEIQLSVPEYKWMFL